MKVRIKSIAFDFTSDDGDDDMPSVIQQQEIIASVVGREYEVDTEDEIANTVSDDTGWLIESIDYDVIEAGQKTFEFHVDEEYVSWHRIGFSIKANSREEAIKIVQHRFEHGGIWGIQQYGGYIHEYDEELDTADSTGRQELIEYMTDTKIASLEYIAPDKYVFTSHINVGD